MTSISSKILAGETVTDLEIDARLLELVTYTIKTNDDLRALNLSYYSTCRLADQLRVVDPHTCIEMRLARDGAVGKLVLDKLGNFVSYRVVPEITTTAA
jgi:hypothetical protein